MRYAVLFPGQNSHYVGMGKKIYLATKEFFKKSGLEKIILEGPVEELNKTENAQPAIVTVSLAVYKILETMIKPNLLAGHSLGEYSALISARAMSFEHGLELVKKRALYMKDVKGNMAALIKDKCDESEIRDICQKTRTEIAAYNSYNQIVISGEETGIEKAMNIARGFRYKTIILNISTPAHSKFMHKIEKNIEKEIEKITICNPNIPVLDGLDASYITDVKYSLIKQLTYPVRWIDVIKKACTEVDVFIEVGPKSILSKFVNEIDNKIKIINIDNCGPKEIEEKIRSII